VDRDQFCIVDERIIAELTGHDECGQLIHL
jgi:hypothetical protein